MIPKYHLPLFLAFLWLLLPQPANARNKVVPLPLLDPGQPKAQRVLKALEISRGKLAPAVKKAFLGFRRKKALDELAQNKIALPREFLYWADTNPLVASSVYGLRWGTPAQALVILRSLELDIGRSLFRKYIHVSLATAFLHARNLDLANPGKSGFSLRKRKPLRIKIPKSPLVWVTTRPTDRPLDIHDHVINFLEEEEVAGKKSAGEKTVITRKRKKALRACDVISSIKLQRQFNAYMKSKGQKITPVNCGNKLT